MTDAPRSIAERQKRPTALRAGKAFRRRYRLAKLWHAARIGVGLVIGTVGVLVALLDQDTSDYVSAAAALWIALGRMLFARLEEHAQQQGAIAQEAFDTEVLDLPWNAVKAGEEPAPEDLGNWGEGDAGKGLDTWYPDPRPAAFPVDVLITQRATVMWARQDRLIYATILRVAAGATMVAAAVLGLALGLSLGEFLLRLGIPILPAIVDLFELAGANAVLGDERAKIAREADRHYRQARDDGIAPSVHACREIQDELYATRRSMGVPSWLYKITRERRERNMTAVVREQVEALPPELRISAEVAAAPARADGAG